MIELWWVAPMAPLAVLVASVIGLWFTDGPNGG